MIFNKGKKYVFSKDVYLASDERDYAAAVSAAKPV